ncbi:MAG: hypothetical protein R3B70_22115 [Polyangiaceae bacterium]
MKRALVLVAIAGLAGAGCASTVPPPGWQQGGAMLWVPNAAWRAGSMNVDLLGDGQVVMNGTARFRIDAAGRVMDADGDPVALLRRDGKLVGNEGEELGTVGPTTAAVPGAPYASLGILPSGQVVRFEENGARRAEGPGRGAGGTRRRFRLVRW